MINYNFKSYTENIKESVNSIPYKHLLFWGAWFCDYLFKKYGKSISVYLSPSTHHTIEEIVSLIWNRVDEKNFETDDQVIEDYELLKEINETELDQNNEIECAIYELIIALDTILNFLIEHERGWEYNISQSTINVIDKILLAQNLDILKEDGFNQLITKTEVDSQFKMIEYLKSHSNVNSDLKNLYR